MSDPDGAPWEVYTVLADATDATDMGCSAETCGPAAGQAMTGEPGAADATWLLPRLRAASCGEARPAPPTPADAAMNEATLWRRVVAELLGSALLAAVVVGSGIAAQQLSPGDTGLQLLENAAATAAGLYAIILMFGPVSGGHFNPVVSFVDAAFGGVRWRTACAYLPAQVVGCIGGAVVANLMFSKAAVSISTHHRASPAHFLSEVVATLGLILVIFALARSGRSSCHAGGGGRLHRSGLLLHQLHQLRQPGHHRRAGCSPTPSPASPRPRSRASWPPRSSVEWPPSGSSCCSIRD